MGASPRVALCLHVGVIPTSFVQRPHKLPNGSTDEAASGRALWFRDLMIKVHAKED